MHMAVAILRVKKGFDYSRILGENLHKTFDDARIIQPNDSSTDLLANTTVHGSNESLSRNVSQGSIKNHFYLFFSPAFFTKALFRN